MPIEFDAGSRAFWSKRTIGPGGQCIPSLALPRPGGIVVYGKWFYQIALFLLASSFMKYLDR